MAFTQSQFNKVNQIWSKYINIILFLKKNTFPYLIVKRSSKRKHEYIKYIKPFFPYNNNKLSRSFMFIKLVDETAMIFTMVRTKPRLCDRKTEHRI